MAILTIENFTALGQISAEYSKPEGDGSFADPKVESTIGDARSYGSGRGVGKLNLVYNAGFTLQPGGAVSIDLVGGADNTRFGDVLNFVNVKAIVIENRAAIDSDVTLDLAGNFFVTHGEPPDVGPEGAFETHRRDADGYAVAGGASDVITITNNSATTAVDIRVAIGGEEIDVSSSSSSSSVSPSSSSSSSSSPISSSSSSSSSTSSASGSSSSSSTEALRSSSSSSSTAAQNSSSSSSSSSL